MAESNRTAAATEVEVAESSVETEQDKTRDYIEYKGDETFGTAFLTTHTIPKGDGLWKREGVTAPKDLVWERDPFGPALGFPGNKMRLAVEDIPADLLPILERIPGYKRVNA